MSLPQPSVALTGACSVLYNDILYAYSPTAFQSLSLSNGAEWEELSYGESVTGGVCVGSTPSDATQAGLYVVGGTSSNSSYYGLQKYTYTTGEWESITPESLVTQDRLYHGAVYLTDPDLILMYAGSQDGSTGESTQTFTIEASYPYSVLSFQSSAPPTKNPILLPWSSSQAAVVGGSVTNTGVYLFNPSSGWYDSGTTLATAFTKDTASVQAALVIGDDTSKNMYVFDMSVSPNEVSRMVLLDASGAAVTSSAAVKRSLLDDDWMTEEEYLEKRANSTLTLENWPAYNSSLAPTLTRSEYCLAADTSGTIVAAGGASSEEVLCIFDGRTNAWENATDVFATNDFSILSTDNTTSTTTSSSATASATATSTSSTVVATTSAAESTTAAAAAASTSVSGTSSGAILGAVLGSVAGAAVILLIAFLLVVRRRKQPGPKGGANNHHGSGMSSEKDSYDVTSRDVMPRPIGGGGATFRNGHQAQDSQGSFSSVAILMGRVNQPRSPVVVRPSNFGDLKDTSAGIPSKGLKGQISKPIPQTMSNLGAAAIPQSAKFEEANLEVPYNNGRNITPARLNEDQAGRQSSIRRSSGWNRYWSGGSALNILGFGNGGSSNNVNNTNRVSANRATMASDVSSNYSVSEQHQHRITQDSATVPPLDIPMMPEARPRFQRVNSGSPTVSGFNNAFKDGLQGKIERSTSNASSQSGYTSGIPSSVHETWDPTGYDDKPWGADRAPSSTYSTTTSGLYSSTALAPPALGAGSGKKAPVPSGMSRQPQLATASTSSDMSWLNLGGQSRV